MIQEEDTSKFLDEATPWERLSSAAQAFFGTPATYQTRILYFYFDHQKPFNLPFSTPPEYFKQLVQYGIENLLVFPYHLIPQLQQFNPVTPFNYYIDMLLRVMGSEKSYQSIPSFSAADALRVTGVGRNQFIEAMNKSRGGGWSNVLKSKGKMLRNLLPGVAIPIKFEPWWTLCVVPIPDSKIGKHPLRSLYERIQKESGPVSDYSLNDIQKLYADNLIYIQIPLTTNDTVKLLPLDNFVMNRVGGDYLEGLCYKSFISIDERTTIENLSKMLAVDVSEISKVLSLFIRLGLAAKFTVETQVETTSPETTNLKRIAAIYDSTLPASLMLGNLGQTVKSHAVTLYEVGKMLDKTVTEFVTALQSIDDTGDDSMVGSFEKCQIISKFALFLKSQEIAPGGVDMLQLESLQGLDAESRQIMIKKNYSALVVMAPLNLVTPSLEISEPVHFGPPSRQFHSPCTLR